MSEKKEYIERGALLSAIGEERAVLNGLSEYGYLKVIREVPAAPVEPVVRGEWVDDENYPESGLKVCSICGHDPLLNGHEERVLSKRCPNCGAHMERSGSGE